MAAMAANAQVMHRSTPSARRSLVSSTRPAARAAGETRPLPRAVPWPGRAWPRRRLSGAGPLRSASCEHLTRNADYVGRRFPEEARRMHYGEVQRRSVYGEATPDQAKELHEEGVEFHPLPVLPDEWN